ncbi:MAG: SCO family protein [Candidatus Ozemobacteraceae bacterium]
MILILCSLFSSSIVFSRDVAAGGTQSSESASTSVLPACCRLEVPASEPARLADLATVTLGIEERLGNILPLDISFTDENGNSRPLKEFFTKPTLLAFVFFTCPSSCNILQSGIVEAVRQVSLVPGKDFNILSVSIDENDSSATASKKKRDFTFALGESFPSDAWHFLSGSFAGIQTLTQAAGFGFRRTEKGLVHPVALIFVTPDGKIVRYLHGTSFLPLNVTLALHEATEGKIGGGIQSVVSFCFTFDPQEKKYVLNILRISGITILCILAVLFYFLLRIKKTRSPEK